MIAHPKVCSRHNQRSADRTRHGFSLIELLSVIALVGTLLSLCAATLNRAYEVHHTALSTFRELEQLNFWYERFLTDAQLAVICEVESNARFMRENGDAVLYKVDQRRLVRVVERDAQTLSQEVLYSPPLADVQWSNDTRGRLPLVSCELRFDETQTSLDPIVWMARASARETIGDAHER